MARLLSQHRYVWIALAALIAALGMATIVALSHPLAGILAILLIVGLLPVLPQWLGSVDATRPHGASTRGIPFPRPTVPLAQRIILTPDGETRPAQVVSLTQSDDHQLVLTVKGYMLLNENGQVIYTLKHDR